MFKSDADFKSDELMLVAKDTNTCHDVRAIERKTLYLYLDHRSQLFSKSDRHDTLRGRLSNHKLFPKNQIPTP